VLPFAHADAAQRSASVLNEALQWRLRSVGFQVLSANGQDTAAVRKLVRAGTGEITFLVGGDVATETTGSVVARLWLKDAGSGKRLWESRFTQPQSDAHLIATQLSDPNRKTTKPAPVTRAPRLEAVSRAPPMVAMVAAQVRRSYMAAPTSGAPVGFKFPLGCQAR
jgi:hypothetical protein